MARLPRKLTTATLGYHHIDWLRQLAERDGDMAMVAVCDAAKGMAPSGALGAREIQRAQRAVVDEINRRAGHPAAKSRTGVGVRSASFGASSTSSSKTPTQLEREIEDATASKAVARAVGPITVVVAWMEDTQEIAPGQKTWRHDLGERPKLIDVKKPHAAMWVNEGTPVDADKAYVYVKKEHPDSGRVLIYPMTEKDPLGRARRDVLSAGSK